MKREFAKVVRVRDRNIGAGAPCFVAAEVGINHNGELSLAKEMVHAAAEAGADSVKFQNYRTDDFLSDRSLTYTYKSQGREVTEPQWDMFKRCELKPGWVGELKQECDRAGVIFFSTPTSEDGVRELVEAGAALLKNGSDYLTHAPLLEFMGTTGIPIVISTGMADQQDVDDALAAVGRGGKSDVVLLHCTSSYPTEAEDTNLSRMVTLRERYRVPVGFSDHTEGWVAGVQAVTLGASFFEKHFTLDRNLAGPDHWFSSTPDELRELVRNLRAAETRLGSASLQPAGSEAGSRRDYRLSIVAARDLREGEVLTREMVAYRRPGTGLPPRELEQLLGRRLRTGVLKGTPLQSDHFICAEGVAR